MEITNYITEMMANIQRAMEEVVDKVREGDFYCAASYLSKEVHAMIDKLLALAINVVFCDAEFRKRLRILGGKRGYRYHEDYSIMVQMPWGNHEQITSPWFAKAGSKRGRRKRGPKGKGTTRKGAHLGLEVLGFFDKISPNLAWKALRIVVLSPSGEIASRLLRDEGITLSQNKIRDLLNHFDALSPQQRVRLSCKPGETLAGHRIVICDDGGRFRWRKEKRGKLKKGAERHGYNTDWKEPKLFTIYAIDESGEVLKEVAAQVDGCTGTLDDSLALLRAYLIELQVAQAEEVTLIGDGARWIWKNLPALLLSIGLPEDKLIELIDYTHAKQNLYETLDLTNPGSSRQRASFIQEMKTLLFQGRIEEMAQAMIACAAKRKKTTLKKKLHEYFLRNNHRFAYADNSGKRPIGSGSVESAIRRVINLRVKSAGIFWLKEKAETMIFLRAKLLYGRWNILIDNWLRDTRREFQDNPCKVT